MSTERVTLKVAIKRHGLEFMRGKPVFESGQTLFISDKSLDDGIDLYKDEPESEYLIHRFYGGVEHNAPMVQWIYTGSASIDVPCANQ